MKACFGFLCVGMIAGSTIAAAAGPCASRIEQVEESVRAKLEQIVASGPSSAETVGARLHHQPTPSSIAAEESRLGQLPQATIDDIKSALNRARDADLLGSAEDCERALQEVEILIRR
jgi:phage-related minor tail protein